MRPWFLLLVHAASAMNILHTFDFPALPYIAGMRYIHSPQRFLTAHGICEAPFRVDTVSQPTVYTHHRTVAFRYLTPTSRGCAHVLSNIHNLTQFLLVDDHGPCITGHLRIRPLPNGGFALRCFASNLRPSMERQLSMIWEGQFAREKVVQAAVRRVFIAEEGENDNLIRFATESSRPPV